MNVIAGSARSLKLKAPNGIHTRPTGARVKESLFNIIANSLYEADFLDLFSGSGAIGIEALSRGAANAVFVDNCSKSIDIINQNLKFTKLSDKADIIKADAVNAIYNINKKFDIIFMDPPYYKGLTQQTLTAINDKKILKKDGFIIAEQALDEPEPYVEGLKIFRIKKYKNSKMTFIENE